MRGRPETVLPKAFQDWKIDELCFEADTEPYAVSRDQGISELAAERGVKVSSFISHTLFDTKELIRRNGGKAPLAYASFVKLVDKLAAPEPVATPDCLPAIDKSIIGTDIDTSVPRWSEMGFNSPPSSPFKGGEKEALRRMEERFSDKNWIAKFEKPNTDPSAFLQPSTTCLSPYLKFGCLSARTFHLRLVQVYKEVKTHSQPPVSLRGQLLWREFFYTVGFATPNFAKMQGNSICRQIDWDVNDAHLQAWKKGNTGFPWIDAIQRQLLEWGWVHHLARHSVACFLTRGDLYLSWEQGQEHFEEHLVDQDHFINAGNWMWLSASAFFSQYFRVYSPIVFGKKYDPKGAFIRRFVPEVAKFPDKYIYEPWLAPISVQKEAGCLIGQEYPKPIVDHTTASKACISRIAVAYKLHRGEAGDEEDDGEAPEPSSAPGASKGKRSAAASTTSTVKKTQKTLEDVGLKKKS